MGKPTPVTSTHTPKVVPSKGTVKMPMPDAANCKPGAPCC